MKSQVDSDVPLRRLASAIVLGAAIVLIVAKFWGWMVTDSVALLTSAADAVVDALAAMATFFGVRFAQHPADLEHRFGHGKGEALAAFAQAILLAGTAAVLAAQSFWRLFYPQQLTAITLGIWIAARWSCNFKSSRNHADLGRAPYRLNSHRRGPGTLPHGYGLKWRRTYRIGADKRNRMGARGSYSRSHYRWCHDCGRSTCRGDRISPTSGSRVAT